MVAASGIIARDNQGRVVFRFAINPLKMPLVRWNGSTYLYHLVRKEYVEIIAIELNKFEVT